MSDQETVYNERMGFQTLLENPRPILVRGIGNSMTPRLKSGQIVRVDPVTSDMVLSKGDIVLSKVRGRVYLHLITGKREVKSGTLYQISNNHGHVNGWTSDVVGLIRDTH